MLDAKIMSETGKSKNSIRTLLKKLEEMLGKPVGRVEGSCLQTKTERWGGKGRVLLVST